MGKLQGYSEMRRNNWAALFCYTIIDAILIACYLLEVVKHSRTVGYFTIFSILALAPLIATHIIYRNNPESELIKGVITGGFGIFYYFVIFTTVSPVAYVYALILSLVMICYNRIRLTAFFTGGVMLGNIVQVAYAGMTHQISAEALPDVEIRIGSTLLFVVYMLLATYVVDLNSKAKMASVQEEKDKADAMTASLLDASEKITANIELVADKMSVLSESTAKTMMSMEEVTKGTTDTADSIQGQLEQTEEIQRTVARVENATEKIRDDIADTRRELDNAQKNIDNLIECVNVSNEENARVSKELSELFEYTNQMQSIIYMIDEITSQTSLLSLNASIEAARAGEAGKGFAVVASEISALATQTQSATENITVLINNISNELADVVTEIENMIKNSEAQNATAHSTAENFVVINSSTDAIYDESVLLGGLVKELTAANQIIVDGIETISAATEEVTAHSNETLQSSEDNTTITNEVELIIGELNQMAQELVK